MKIDKSKLKLGLWYTDENDEVIPSQDYSVPEGAVFAHSCFPLEIRHEIFRIRDDGSYGGKDKVITLCSNLGRGSEDLIIAMVNSGDYRLGEALVVLASCCERCLNVMWNKYLPEMDGYEEYSPEWQKCNTVCEFCEGENDEPDIKRD